MTREFEEIVVEYPPKDLCTYPEYKGKPYFSIKYKEGNNHFIGYGTYKPEVLSRFLRDDFMPSIRPIHKDRTVQDFVDKCRECGKQRWIPCSERLPEKSGDYLCTFGGNNLVGSDFYTAKSDAERIFDEPEEYIGWRSQNVIAWMPLPEPYKVESEE